MKKITKLCIAVLSISLLTGCGMIKQTPEKILTKANQRLSKVEDYTGTIDMLMNMDVDGEKIETNYESEIEYSKKDGITYTDGNIQLKAQDIEKTISIETYTTKKTSYTNINGVWSKSEVPEQGTELFIQNIDKLSEYLELNEKTKNENGKECYQLSGKVPFDEISDSIPNIQELLEDVKVDNVNYDLYIDKKTFEIVNQTITYDMDVDGIKADIELECIFDEYNTGIDLSIPEEAKEGKGIDKTETYSPIEETTKPKETQEETKQETAIKENEYIFKNYDDIPMAKIAVEKPYFIESDKYNCEVGKEDASDIPFLFFNCMEDSYQDDVKNYREYMGSKIIDEEEKTTKSGQKYTLFISQETQEKDYLAIIGNDKASVEVYLSGYWINEFDLDVNQIFEDMISYITFL